jgi:hypothetical protein
VKSGGRSVLIAVPRPFRIKIMIISIERERDTPTPGKSARFRVSIRAVADGHVIFISARNFGSVVAAKNGMDELFGPLDWHEASPEARHVRAIATKTIL